jgi:hypothetical protein
MGLRAKRGFSVLRKGLRIGHQEKLIEFLSFIKWRIDVHQGEILKLTVHEEGIKERIYVALVQEAPQEVVLTIELVHHGHENTRHGQICHLSV